MDKYCGRSQKASRHETINDETETIGTRPRHRPETSNFGLETEIMSPDLTSLPPDSVGATATRFMLDRKYKNYLRTIPYLCSCERILHG